MIKKIKNVLVVLATLSVFTLPVLAPVAVHADATTIKDGVCAGTNLKFVAGGDSSCNNADTPTAGLNALLTKIINIFSIIVGVIAVIMIIVGGLKYITSGGESSNISGAKNTILFALVGLVIVALAQFIVHFVLGSVNNAVQ